MYSLVVVYVDSSEYSKIRLFPIKAVADVNPRNSSLASSADDSMYVYICLSRGVEHSH
jgi:hypothetical protein